MNKNELFSKLPPVLADTYHEFQGHYIFYGSLTLAGIAAGVHLARELREHRQNTEIVEGFNKLLTDEAEQPEAA